MMIERVRERWDELVAEDFLLADPAAMREAMTARGLMLGERSLCNVARPRFVAQSDVIATQQMAGALVRALRAVWRRMWAAYNSGGTGLPGFDEWIAHVAAANPENADDPIGQPGTILRMDAYGIGRELGVLEFNADVPEGAIMLHGIRRVFEISDTWSTVCREFPIARTPLQQGQDRALLSPWRGEGRPRIGIVGWDEGAEAVTARMVAVHLRMHGYTVMVAEPAQCACEGERFIAAGEPVDVIYRLCHLPDMFERREETAALFEAARRRVVPLVNPLVAELLSHKYLLAVLHHDPWRAEISEEDRALLEAAVPWGAVVAEGPCGTPEGCADDLAAWISNHREELVLKAAHGQGGEDVLLGWTSDASEWDAFLQRLLTEGGVVQGRVSGPRESYPLIAPGMPQEEFYCDTVAYVFDARPAGLGTRLSRSEITNVSRGGSIVPVVAVNGE